MKIKISKQEIEIDKIFVNKKYSIAILKGSKLKLWFNNLSFSDYVFLDKMGDDTFSSCGLDDIYKAPKDYKKNLLFINTNKMECNLYLGSFVNTLEKDRCLLSYDSSLPLVWSKYSEVLNKYVNAEIRKEKISTLLHEN